MAPLHDDPGPAGTSGSRRTDVLAAALGVAALAILAALLAGAGAPLFGILSALFPVALVALALAGQGRLRRNAAALAVLAALLVGSVGAMLLLRGGGGEGLRPAGLPLSLAVLFLGIWLVPLLVTGLAHALTFDDGPDRAPSSHVAGEPPAGSGAARRDPGR